MEIDLNVLQNKIHEKVELYLEVLSQTASEWPKGLKITVIIFSFFSSMILGYFLFVSEKVSRLNMTTVLESSLKDQYIQQIHKTINLPVKKEYLNKLKDYYATDLSKNIPNIEDYEQILKIINSVTTQNGLRIRRLLPLDSIDHDFYLELPFKIEIQGSFPNVRKMCQELVHMKRFMSVDLVEVRLETLSGKEKIVKYTLQVSAYHMKNVNIPQV